MWSHMDGWGPGWGWFMLGHALWWAVVLLGIVLLLRWALRLGRRGDRPTAAPDRAVDVLRERYARGEIGQEEYEQRKRVLGA